MYCKPLPEIIILYSLNDLIISRANLYKFSLFTFLANLLTFSAFDAECISSSDILFPAIYIVVALFLF